MLLRRDHGSMVVLPTGHFGNWEILGYVPWARWVLKPPASLARLDNPYVNRYGDGHYGAEKHGQKIVDKKGATEPVLQALEANGVVGFIADQNAGPKGVFVDFFGRKASTYKSIALVAMQFNVPVIIGGAKRLNDRFTFEFFMQDIIWPDDWKKQDDPLRYITQPLHYGIRKCDPALNLRNISGPTVAGKLVPKEKWPSRMIDLP